MQVKRAQTKRSLGKARAGRAATFHPNAKRTADWYDPGDVIGDWEAEDLAWELHGAEPPQWLVDGMLSEFEGAKVRQVNAIVGWAKNLPDAGDTRERWRAVTNWARKHQRKLFPDPEWDEAEGRGYPATARRGRSRKGRSRTAVDPNKFRGINPGDRVSTPDGTAGVAVQLGSENRELFNGSPYVVIRLEEGGSTRDETYPVDQVRTARRSFKLPPIRIDRWEHRVEGQSRRGKITRTPNGWPIRGVIRGRVRRTAEEDCPHPASRNYAGVADDATSSTGRTVWVGCRDCGEIIAEYDAPAVKPAGRSGSSRGRVRRTAAPQPTDPEREGYDDLYQRTVERHQSDPNITPEAVEQAVEKAWEMDDPNDEEVDEHVDVFLGKESRRLNLPCPQCRGKTARRRDNPNLFVCQSKRCGLVSEVVL